MKEAKAVNLGTAVGGLARMRARTARTGTANGRLLLRLQAVTNKRRSFFNFQFSFFPLALPGLGVYMCVCGGGLIKQLMI